MYLSESMSYVDITCSWEQFHSTTCCSDVVIKFPYEKTHMKDFACFSPLSNENEGLIAFVLF